MAFFEDTEDFLKWLAGMMGFFAVVVFLICIVRFEMPFEKALYITVAFVGGLLGLVGGGCLYRYLKKMRDEDRNYQLAQENWRQQQQREQQEAAGRQVEYQEGQRLRACQQIVALFNRHLGYITSQVISPEKMAELIASGITADALSSELSRRIGAVQGMMLGYQILPPPNNAGKFDVKQTQEYRDRHTYIIGKSGSGKTNLLRNLILQDLQAGNGLGVIAPEAEMLTEEILPFIPPNRVDDVIYINPADDAPVCFNPLQLDPGEDPALKADEMFTIFMRLTSESGPRMDEILRNVLAALVGRPGATLLDIGRLLDRSDDGFRNEIIRECQDEMVSKFLREYPSYPKDAHLPITTRLGRLLGPKSVRAMLCNPGRSLNFRQCMDDGQVMLFNLSDGLLGEQNSQTLGQLVVSKFQLAVMARARQSKANRRNFYLYIDEFQTFTGTAAASYEKILSRARKYNLGLILAHQQTGQIPASLLKEIMGNVSTNICFALSGEDARKFSREFIITNADGKVAPIPEMEILQLPVGEAWCKIGQHAFRMHTHLARQHGDPVWAQSIIEASRRKHGTRATGRQGSGARSSAGSTKPGGTAAGTSEEDNIFE